MTENPQVPSSVDPQRRAQRAAEILAADTPVTAHGVGFVQGDDSGCQMALEVRTEQCNSHGICHGGITMFLADTAAAYALNTGEDTPRWVTSASASSFLAPARAGAVLTATARLRSGTRSTRIVDVTVEDPEGVVVLEMRNTMTRLKG